MFFGVKFVFEICRLDFFLCLIIFKGHSFIIRNEADIQFLYFDGLLNLCRFSENETISDYCVVKNCKREAGEEVAMFSLV